MNNSYITIIKEKRTVLSRKRVPLNQNECTADFRIGVPFEQNLHVGDLYRSYPFDYLANIVTCVAVLVFHLLVIVASVEPPLVIFIITNICYLHNCCKEYILWTVDIFDLLFYERK